MLKKTAIVALTLMSGLAFSQDWSTVKEDPKSSLSEIKQAFETEWSGKAYEKGKGYKTFKRWYNFVEPRSYPKGNPNDAYRAPEEFQKYLAAHPELRAQMEAAEAARLGGGNQVLSTTWSQVGPAGTVPGGGAGRINKVVLDPVTSTTMYACAPAGSLWKSINSGTSWTVLTDNLPVIGCSDLVINPSNNQEMYLATGDADAGDNPSIGVYKSTNGGTTWTVTGLTFNASAGTRIRRMLIHPTNPQIVMCASNAGFYRTTNGGTSWTQITTNSYRDMEFNPLNPNVIHAVSTSDYFRSSNAGLTWSNTGNGTNLSTGAGRFCLAVTPADTNYVYVLAGATGNGFLAFYRSTNSGNTFTSMSTTPNLLGWSNTGGDTGGQAFYDLCCAASPTNKDEVVTGGVNIWRTTNGGTNFSIYGHWTGSGAPYVHADVHDVIYTSAAVLYVGCDGGVFRRGASSYTDLSGNMSIAQPYAVGCSGSTQNLLITGHQDNGTNKWNGTAWSYAMGGDGMVAFIDKTNNNNMYGSQYSGSLNRSTNGGVNWNAITTGLPGTGPWVTRWMHDPTTSTILYSGFDQVYKSTNSGTNWAVTGTMAGSGDIVSIDIAKSNTQVVYAARATVLAKSTNGGTSWTTITGTLPVGSAQITDIAIDPTDPNNAWVTFTGFAAGTKVYVTTNGGTSWTNYSTGLPNIPVNTVVYQPGATNDAIYIGTDVGVYYRDNLQASWTSYMIGLPNVVVADLDFYAPTLKLRAATYGRGVWEVDANNPGNLAPVADFTSNRQVICPAMTVTYTDVSAFTPTSWSWIFQGGTPATSTVQNPVITYNTAGTYSVQLTATNANGSNAVTKTTYITVTGVNALPLIEGFVAATFPPTGWTTKDANSDGIFWTRNGTIGYNTTNSMMFDNYNLDAAGSRDEMQTMKYNFSSFSSATLTFDVAYREYDAQYSDTLAVMVSTDCGVTFTQAYLKGGPTLSTVAGTYTTAIFAPTGNPQWRSETVSLNSYAGQGSVMVVFQNRGHYGQALYVDNINITGTSAGAPPTAIYTTSTTKCVGQNITFTDGSTGAPTSWAWTFAGGTPATSTLQNPVVTFATSGAHTATLVATNANGPSTPSVQTFTVNAVPTAGAGLNKVITCASPVAQLNGSGGGTYAWSGPSGYTSTLVQPNVLNPGTYTLVVTTTGCASLPATVTVTTNTTLPSASASTTATITCSTSTGVVNASSSTSGATYAWTGTGIVSGGTTNAATVNAAGIFTVTVTDPANSCVRTATVTVTSNTVAPNATANSTANLTCTTLTGTVTGASSTPGATFVWSGPGIVSGGATTSATVNAAGTYTFTVTNPANGCTNVATAIVGSNTTPPNATSSTTATLTCTNLTGTVNANSSTSGATFSWAGPGITAGGTTNAATVNASGAYTVTVTNPANGCTATSVVNVTSNTTAPAIATVTQAGNVLTSSSATNNQWYFNGTIMPGETNQNLTVTQNGNYTVVVTNPTNGCFSTSAIFVVGSIGISVVGINGDLNVYPNPSNGEFAIVLTLNEKSTIKIEIRNVLGQLVYDEEIPSASGQINRNVNIGTYGSGNYILTVSNKKGKTVKKIIVQ